MPIQTQPCFLVGGQQTTPDFQSTTDKACLPLRTDNLAFLSGQQTIPACLSEAELDWP